MRKSIKVKDLTAITKQIILKRRLYRQNQRMKGSVEGKRGYGIIFHNRLKGIKTFLIQK